MEFGVCFTPEKDYRPVIDDIKLAEDVGFSFAALFDSPYNFMDMYPVFGVAAEETSRIHLGPLVTNPLTRHPSVTASTMATLQVMSEGRAFLGIGRGDSSVKMLGWKPATWKSYEKSLVDMRAWMAGEPVEVEGAPGPLVLPWAKDIPTVPLDLGLFGPRGAGVAGRLGDIGTTECAELGAVEWMIANTRKAAAEAGREVQFEVSIMTYVSDDVAKARELCRWEPEILTNLIWHLLHTYPADQLPPSLIKGFEWLADEPNWWDKHDWSVHAQYSEKHAEIISDEIVDRFCVCGTVQTCVDKLKELEKLGVDRFCAYFIGITPEERTEQVRVFGEQILPHFA